MRAHWKTVSALAVGAGVGLVAAGCQTYDFEPVEPISIARQETEKVLIARNLKPNVTLLVDKSGSMDAAVDPSAPGCQTTPNCGQPGQAACPAGCPTRWDDLQSAMHGFLSSADTGYFRLGLAAFPQPPSTPGEQVTPQLACTPSTRVLLDILDEEAEGPLQAHAGQVLERLKDIRKVDTVSLGDDRTGGGTPAALSLKYLRENVPGLRGSASGRVSFILLLTDGLPNCNPSNPNGLGALDREGPVAEISALRELGVRTIVVGFGADTAGGEGPEVLRAMANAGGYQRTCTTASDCGTGTCDSGLCSEPYFQAASGVQLAEALAKIAKDVQVADPCTFVLETQPSDASLLSVRINGERVPARDGSKINWTYQSPSVLFQGAVCEQIKSSTPANPVTVSIVAVQGG